MKTTKIFSVLTLVVILASFVSSYAAAIDKKNDPAGISAIIRYQVNVVFSPEQALCNLWLVKVVDGNGKEVAPPKRYTTDVSTYVFFESGPASGARIAVLVKYQYGDHFNCKTELFTEPAALFGTFQNGQTYRFDLYPSAQPPRE